MAVIVAKEYLRYHGNTRNLTDKHASGVKIHNMICTIILLNTLYLIGLLIFMEKKSAKYEIREFTKKMVCIDSITNSYSLVSMATSYFTSNRFFRYIYIFVLYSVAQGKKRSYTTKNIYM